VHPHRIAGCRVQAAAQWWTVFCGRFFQPIVQGADRGDADPGIGRLARADLNRQAAATIGSAETILVGDVVTDENGDTARKGRRFQEPFDRGALVGTARFDLQHHLAGLDMEPVAEPHHQPFHCRMGIVGGCGRVAEMQGHGHALGFQPGAGMIGGETFEVGADRRQRLLIDGGAGQFVECPPLFQTVLPGGRQSGRAEPAVDIVDGATADHRHGAIERLMQPLQQLRQAGCYPDGVGLGGDVHQSAVEIQEQRPVGRRRRQVG
jgi:hypothetical protein